MLQIGIRLHDAEDLPLEQLFPVLRGQGMTCCHLALKKSFPDVPCTPSALTPGYASWLRRTFEQGGIQIAILGNYLNLLHPDPDYIAQADKIKAYRITVAPGRPGAFVLGKLQPLNYGEQVERVKRLALPVQQVTLSFEDGETRIMSYADYTSRFCELMCHCAPIKTTHYQPENEGELSALLYTERHPPKQRSRRPKKPPAR